jgi:cysteine desulfurase
MRKIYMDHAATTPLDPRVFEEMKPYFSEKFGNASSIHSFGREAAEAKEKAREQVAKVINAEPGEIVFTSGGTESDNHALKGVAFASSRGAHIITSKIEHECVLATCKWLEKQGFGITYLGVDKHGCVNPDDVEKAIVDKKTVLVSVMAANNEIGTIEPIAEIGKLCHDHGVLFHTDAVQGYDKMSIDVKKMHIDMLTISAHKLYGPKGSGALYVRSGVSLDSLMHGGGQEGHRRSGTYNTPGIVGLGKAAELSSKEMLKETPRLTKLRDKLIKGVTGEINSSYLNGHPTKRLANNAHFRFDFIEGESLLLMLDGKGIAGSTGSACSSASLAPSHVLLALGLTPAEAHGSLRLTLGKQNTNDDIDYVIKELPPIVKQLRKASPFKTREEFRNFAPTEGHEHEH